MVVTANPDEQGPPPLSTHQAHYVPHPLQAGPRKEYMQKPHGGGFERIFLNVHSEKLGK